MITQKIINKKRIKNLLTPIKYRAGRDNKGQVSIRNRGGQHKQKYRLIDFKRDKYNIPATVVAIDYDPNRTADIALLHYKDGEKRYIIAPNELKINDIVLSGESVEMKIGNALPLKKITVGKEIHNIELKPGEGGKIIRSAGGCAIMAGYEGVYAKLKLSSGEIRLVHGNCYATIGQVSRIEKKKEEIGKAGRKRWLGLRPKVRGSAQHPGSHPHGGGEGRTGAGMPSPKTPWGRKTLGKKTRKIKKYSDRFIVKDRRK